LPPQGIVICLVLVLLIIVLMIGSTVLGSVGDFLQDKGAGACGKV